MPFEPPRSCLRIIPARLLSPELDYQRRDIVEFSFERFSPGRNCISSPNLGLRHSWYTLLLAFCHRI